jgi:hypothetical protein
MSANSLAKVAADYLPPGWTDGERWLSRRLRRGELRGVRFGRTWVMRDSDIEYMLERYSNVEPVADEPAPREPACVADGLSSRSRRRLRSV